MLAANSRAHVDCVSRVLKNADRLPQAPVPPLILDSWRRSMELYRLDPASEQGPRILSQALLNECRERSELFLRIAGDAVARLHEQVREADYCVLLTDARAAPSITGSSRPFALTAARPACTWAPAGRKEKRVPAGWRRC